ncbi:hypothetical protein [Bacillus cereus]|uniref:hypothetical protein n=1 Tax=Bacillus cereus TaxID=1396 RepID=UPI0035C99F3A
MIYIVSVNFDMSHKNELITEIFLDVNKAIIYAQEQKQEFLNQISNDGALDEEMTTFEDEKENEIFYFHGLSQDREDSVIIHVFKAKFKDIPSAEILIPEQLHTIKELIEELEDLISLMEIFSNEELGESNLLERKENLLNKVIKLLK